jgi:hypothetical protein
VDQGCAGPSQFMMPVRPGELVLGKLAPHFSAMLC